MVVTFEPGRDAIMNKPSLIVRGHLDFYVALLCKYFTRAMLGLVNILTARISGFQIGHRNEI